MTKAAIRTWGESKASNERAPARKFKENLGNWPGTKTKPFPSKEISEPGTERNRDRLDAEINF